MKRKKMIAKPRYIKTLGMWLAIFWIITATAFGGLYFLTDRKCKETYKTEYDKTLQELRVKGEDLETLYGLFASYRKEEERKGKAEPFETETNQAISDLYRSLYEYAVNYDTNTYYEIVYSTEKIGFPLYFDNVGALAELSDDKDEISLLRPARPVTDYEYTSEDLGVVEFPVKDPAVISSDKEAFASVLDKVNNDFVVPIWYLGDLSFEDKTDQNIVTIDLKEFYIDLNDRTFIPKRFEYKGREYVNTYEPEDESLNLHSESDRRSCVMSVYRRPDGFENSDASDAITARSLPDYRSFSVDLKQRKLSSFIQTMPDVVIKNAMIWFSVSTLLAVGVAYIAYLRERATYDIFEYRKKVTDSMAHDLKTPLAAMSVYAENLEDNINTEKREYYAARIRENIDFMNKTVEGILDFSRSETGNGRVDRKDVDIRSIVEKEYKETEELFKRKDIKVNITGDLKIRSDEELLTQAIRNLIGNVERYARNSSTVEVRIDRERMTVTNLTDTKIKNVKDLKKPFVKGEQARGGESGTGLGLSIADNCLLTAGHSLELEFEDETFKAIVIW